MYDPHNYKSIPEIECPNRSTRSPDSRWTDLLAEPFRAAMYGEVREVSPGEFNCANGDEITLMAHTDTDFLAYYEVWIKTHWTDTNTQAGILAVFDAATGCCLSLTPCLPKRYWELPYYKSKHLRCPVESIECLRQCVSGLEMYDVGEQYYEDVVMVGREVMWVFVQSTLFLSDAEIDKLVNFARTALPEELSLKLFQRYYNLMYSLSHAGEAEKKGYEDTAHDISRLLYRYYIANSNGNKRSNLGRTGLEMKKRQLYSIIKDGYKPIRTSEPQ